MSRKKWLFVAAAILCLVGCIAFLPCLQTVRDGEGWQWSASHLRQIGLALHSYHSVYGQLPPAVKHGKDGRPLYSWRVLLLPFLEQQPLFRQFNLDEPWDSPHNKPLLEKIPKCYTLGVGGYGVAGMTSYQVFIGPGTTFERDGLTWDDFPDGLPNTLLVVEAANPVPWTKPADLAYIPDKPLPALGGFFHKPIYFWCYEIGSRDGFTACFADGKVRFIRADTDERTLRGLITRNGGEQVGGRIY
jgi:hypothetical protein